MEVRLDIEDAYVHEMQEKLGGQVRPFDMVRDGLTVLRWVVEEAASGRLILSSTADGSDLKQLVMPTLSLAELAYKQSESAGPDAPAAHTPAVQKRE